jgi:hypothetical protein
MKLSIIVLMTEAVSTSETSINFYQTMRRNTPEDNHLHTTSFFPCEGRGFPMD